MHEAACIGDHQRGGLGSFQVADLSLKPFRRELRMLYREDSTEAAAFLCVRQIHHLRAADLCQQCARLCVYVHAAQRMAGGMIGERPVPARTQISYAQYVHNILCKFIYSFSQRHGPWEPERILLEQLRIPVFEHIGAGAGGRDNVAACPFKYPNGMLGNRTGLGSQACVKVGLPTASLIGRKLHIHSQVVENAYDCLTRLRVEGVDQAGDEKLDGGHQSILPLVPLLN